MNIPQWFWNSPKSPIRNIWMLKETVVEMVVLLGFSYKWQWYKWNKALSDIFVKTESHILILWQLLNIMWGVFKMCAFLDPLFRKQQSSISKIKLSLVRFYVQAVPHFKYTQEDQSGSASLSCHRSAQWLREMFIKPYETWKHCWNSACLLAVL